MGLFSRKSPEPPSDRHRDSLTERQLTAHKVYEAAHGRRNAAAAAVNHAIDHGTAEDIERTNADFVQAEHAMWKSLDDSIFWHERRTES
ncbi:hypothetical protein J5Y04_21325 [Kitasatospora sp. RG8]|uniref:hypothetical protein n=1 Tax=Kitasatospora sp. RG8 TaxID=2820815 RepID=UPI001AE0677C|nr:hypothetical protein [Kitasatospora sp. RG8]MBP0452060.1 hypothetical protein [Kitasatospora sp. RG8]